MTKPEQEPVAWIRFDSSGRCRGLLSSDSEDLTESRKAIWQPLYTAPPQRQWVSLTPEEVKYCIKGMFGSVDPWQTFAHALEAKLKEKNCG